jgi:hypothetical protein
MTKGAFSPDGRLLAFATTIERPVERFAFGRRPPNIPGIRVWHVNSGREMRQFEGCLSKSRYGWISSLRFSPDSRSLAVAVQFNGGTLGDDDQCLAPVLEVASGLFRRKLKGHRGHVASVAFSPDGKRLATGSLDSTILLWDMTRLAGTESASTSSPAERLTQWWNALAEEDAANAYDAVVALSGMPKQSVSFLAERLRPAIAPTKEELAKLIADLDHGSFNIRQMASAKLSALHELALPALKKATSGQASAEARQRLAKLIDQLDAMKYSPARLRELRSIEVLERVANREARQLLDTLTTGAAESMLTLEATAALARLK